MFGRRALLLVFLLGLGAGMVGFLLKESRPAAASYGALPTAAEPVFARELVTALVQGDSSFLGANLSDDQLLALSKALDPLIAFTEVAFSGAVSDGVGVRAGYIVSGMAAGSRPYAVGLILDVSDRVLIRIN